MTTTMAIQGKIGIIVGLFILVLAAIWLIDSERSGTQPPVTTEPVSDAPIQLDQQGASRAGIPRNEIDADTGSLESTKAARQFRQDPFVLFMSMLAGETAIDLPTLAQMYEQLEEGPEKYAAFFSLIRFWAQTDADAAMRYALSVKVKERDTEKLYECIYGELARNDPKGFLARILNEFDPDMRAGMSAAAVQLLSHSDPALVIPVIDSVQDLKQRESLLKKWVKEACKSQPESVLDAVAGFQDLVTRQNAAAAAMMEVSRILPELAGFHYSKLLYDTESKVSVLPDIIKGYYRNSNGSIEPVEQWIQSNLHTTEEYNAAAATMVELLVEENIDAALNWTDKITDENLFNATVQEIEKKYSKRNKTSAPGP